MKRFWVWLTGRIFIISTIFATSLLIITIILKGTHYLSESRFAVPQQVSIHEGTLLKVVYPSQLEVRPFQDSKKQIFVGISNYRAVKRLQVTIDFSESEGILFSDSEGNVVSSVMTLDTARARNSASIYVRPEPLADDSPIIAKLSMQINAIQDGQTVLLNKDYDINVNNPDGIRLGYWLDSVLGDVGLPLGFAVAILGWVIDYRNRQKEEASKERLSMVQSLRELANTNPIEAMQRLLEYEADDKKQKWERSLQAELKTLRSLFESRDHLGELLFSVGEAIERGDYYEGEKILSAAIDYFSTRGLEINEILTCIKEKPLIPREDVDSLLRCTLELWKKYDEYSRRIVVHIIGHIWNEYKASPDIVNLIKNSFEGLEGAQRAKLLRYPEIKKTVMEFASSRKYEWSGIPFSFSPSEDSNIEKWLNVPGNRLRGNPFILKSATDLSVIFLPPKYWDQIQNASSTIITTPSKDDLNMILRFLEFDFKNKSTNIFDVFPVTMTLEHTGQDLTHQDIIKMCTDAIANTWIKLISLNPGAFLNLSQSQQFLLVEFLALKSGSPSLLEFRMRQQGLKDTLAGKMIFKRVKEAPDKASLASLSNEKIYEWMSLKPPDLGQTYILVDFYPGSTQKIIMQNIEALLSVSQTFSRTRTQLKIFAIPFENALFDASQIKIEWDLQTLEKILDSCVARVSHNIPDLTFSSLFWPESYPYATKKIAKLAKGSLSQLLLLGNQVIKKHIQRDFQNPYLDVSDLQGIK